MSINFSGAGNTLMDTMIEPCRIIEKRTVPDGLGTYRITWVDGVEFMALIRKDESLEAKVAEKQGVTEVYTIVAQKGFPLQFHDVVRRERTGEILRVTSNIADKEAPDASTIKVGSVTAERWTIPDA